MSIDKRNKCSYADDCQNTFSGRLLDGKSYCNKHYNELLETKFRKKYASWECNAQPSSALRTSFGRFANEKWELRGSSLSKARIRDRAFNFQKEDSGFTFEITRHPGAFKNQNPYAVNRVVQKWKVSWATSVHDGVAECIGERPWTPNDPDETVTF